MQSKPSDARRRRGHQELLVNEMNAELEAALTTPTAGSNHEKYTY